MVPIAFPLVILFPGCDDLQHKVRMLDSECDMMAKNLTYVGLDPTTMEPPHTSPDGTTEETGTTTTDYSGASMGEEVTTEPTLSLRECKWVQGFK